MMTAWLSLVLLFASSLFGARRLLRVLGFARSLDQTPTLIAFGTLVVAWCTVSAHVPAMIAELTGLVAVRMPIIAAVSMMAAIVLAIIGRGGHEPAATADRGESLVWWWRRLSPGLKWACVVPVVVLHVFLLICAALRPPSSFDGLLYHLPLVVRWLQSGRLGIVEGIVPFNMPGNGELWQMLFASVRIEPLIEMAFVPMGLLLGLVVVGLSRELGARPAASVVAGLLALVCPMVALQMFGSYVDLFGTAFILAAFYWLIRLWRRWPQENRMRSYLILTGLSIGLAVGSRMLLLPWAAGIVIGFLLFLLTSRPQSDAACCRGRRVVRAILVLVLSISVSGGFWYVRNVCQTGRVLYPLEFRMAGLTIGSGLMDNVRMVNLDVKDRGLACLAYPWFEWKDSGYPYVCDNGLGPGVAVLGVPGLVYLAIRRRRLRRPADRWIGLWTWGFILGGVVLYMTIFRPYARYILPSWLLMLVAAGLLLDLLLLVYPRMTAAFTGFVIVLSVAMIALHPAKSLMGRLVDRDLSRSHAYQLPELFDQLRPGTVVLNLGPGSMNYPLCGAGLANRVVDSMAVFQMRLRPPVSRAVLDELGVDVVYTRDEIENPFAPDVKYDVLFDDSNDTRRPAGAAVTRVYRVARIARP